ncbi:A-kinase anchor protein inhibitor 1 isoform X1 [Ciconia boyciana]|uniref:A-kinase anchor protein inhibitor 1 isoform X1 n=1 Tax=Ciconia boyciana TaxID=52775 RepID=UPI003BA216A5
MSLAAENLCIAVLLEYSWKGEKPGTEQDEVKLQNASKQIVQTAILRAVQQVSQESQQKEKRTNNSTSLQLERGKLTKKHEKK